MSDDVFQIATPFGDVAELGQGYINRADGERILLPLPSECAAGEGARFVVHLADGTPAFAGAGRCVQVSDQGGTVVAAERFETLLDNLAFDDRSRPVYEYIVAVRQAVYAAGGPEAQEAHPAEQAVAEQEVAQAEIATVSAEPNALSEAPEPAAAELLASEEDATAFIDASAIPVANGDSDAPGVVVDATVAELLTESLPPVASLSEPAAELLIDSQPAPRATPEPEVEVALASEPAPPVQVESVSQPAPASALSLAPSAPVAPLLPESLPTGMLKRPALAAHWQPAAPRPPQPGRGTGLFRYPAGPLPVPAHPPRPDLDPALGVQPAPSPGA